MPSTSPFSAVHASATKTVRLLQLDELPALRIHNDQADALITLQGAQLLEFTPRGQRPVIWLSEQAEFKRGGNIRGGVPICWPWFGDLARNPSAVRNSVVVDNDGAEAKLPAHGLVRAQPWLLDAITETADNTRIVLHYPTAALASSWPQSAELILTVDIGRSLRMQLATRNSGANAFALSQALHSYFAVSDTRNIELRGFEQTRYIDTLSDWSEFSQQGAIHIDGEVDRIYLQVPEHICLYDKTWQRSIHLRARNSASAVVWNPHIEKSKRLNQMSSDAWQRMLCIETANVLNDSVTLAAGAEHILDVEMWSETGAV